MTEALKNQLEDLRVSLLRLHKALLDIEKIAYEEANGPVGTTGRLLSLVMSDPWFDWLHRISRLVVQMDQVLEGKAEGTDPHSLFRQAAELLLPSDTNADDEFTKRYKISLKKSSAAVLSHAAVLKAIQAGLKSLKDETH